MSLNVSSLIQALNKSKLIAECPHCGDEFALSKDLDNLYLTCQSCNSSLGDKFPDALLRKEIEKRGTIGYWLRKYEKSLKRNMKLSGK